MAPPLVENDLKNPPVLQPALSRIDSWMTTPLLPAHLQIAFDPVPVEPRRDGWTPGRQRDFIDALMACGSVKMAACYAGMSAKSAYRLCARGDAASFADAWDEALDAAIARVEARAFDRATNGTRDPVFFGGRQIGSRTRYDDRLALAVLRHRRVSHCATCDALISSFLETGSAEFLHELVGRS